MSNSDSKNVIKTMLYLGFAMVLLLLFKPQFASFFENLETVEGLGFKLKAKKSIAEQYNKVKAEYEQNISMLRAELDQQEVNLNQLLQVQGKLEDKLASCDEAKPIFEDFKIHMKQVALANDSVAQQAKKIPWSNFNLDPIMNIETDN